jgi:hypothetical protein
MLIRLPQFDEKKAEPEYRACREVHPGQTSKLSIPSTLTDEWSGWSPRSGGHLGQGGHPN